jgi:glucokinase
MKQTYAIGIDVGGSSLKCGIVSSAGDIVHYSLRSLDNVKTEAAVIGLIANVIRNCTLMAGGAVSGVGIGFPGIVDDNVIIGGADNLPGFKNLPLGTILEKDTRNRIYIDNDANMMAFGELVYGAGRNCSDMVFLTVGTGIGGALVINNKLYGGYKNRGTELGHVILQRNGVPCSCGAKGCFEAYASVTALINDYRIIKNGKMLDVNGKIIVEQYLQNEKDALSVMDRHFDYMATGIAGFINVFSPQKIVVGGGISEAGDFYIREIESRVKQIAMPATMENTTIVAAALGNKAGMLGCAARAFEADIIPQMQ